MTSDLQRSGSVLLVGRKDCEFSTKAIEVLASHGFDLTFLESSHRGENLSSAFANWHGDYILCFRSLYILTKEDLARARVATINFHPGPPERRGTGCLNYALYHNDAMYGVTAHLVNEEIGSND